MKTVAGKKIKHALFLSLVAASSGFAAHDWSRYEVITERAPFGKEPPPSETAESARPSGEFAKQYRLCMLYEGVEGQLKAGIVSKVSNKNFFLQAGESEEGLSLVEVRLEEGIVVVRQDGETAQLLLEGVGGNPAAAQAQKQTTVAALIPEAASVQVCRAGADSAPEHILAGLTDSAPKQPHITVRETKQTPSGGSVNDESNSTLLSGVGNPVVVQTPMPASYLVQSVPKRYSCL